MGKRLVIPRLSSDSTSRRGSPKFAIASSSLLSSPENVVVSVSDSYSLSLTFSEFLSNRPRPLKASSLRTEEFGVATAEATAEPPFLGRKWTEEALKPPNWDLSAAAKRRERAGVEVVRRGRSKEGFWYTVDTPRREEDKAIAQVAVEVLGGDRVREREDKATLVIL